MLTTRSNSKKYILRVWSGSFTGIRLKKRDTSKGSGRLSPQDMSEFTTVRSETLEELQHFDSCTISNAVEQFHVRTRNERFVNGTVRCIFPQIPPRAGYAVTARARTSSTPMSGRCYYDRMNWWSYLHNTRSVS